MYTAGLVAVTERSGPGGADVTTSYSYDVGNRLTCVSTTSAGVTQQREFRYDGRGFLLAERHPELGVNGNAWVKYWNHDARGNALARGIAEPSGATPPEQLEATAQILTMRYDAAGRKLETLHGDQPLEQWFYSRTNSGGNFSKGKLVEAKRWNPGGRAPGQ